MSYEIEYSREALRSLKKLPKDVSRILFETIEALADDPKPQGVEILTEIDGYRVRHGDYRIVYTVDNKAILILVLRVGHRREIYRDLRDLKKVITEWKEQNK